jgi:Spy/CpxP family protein refolding chaperone
MSSEKTNPKSGRKIKTLDEEIAAQREKLRKLEERQREQQRKEREKNQKAVMELIKTERLDAVPSELWREAMPKIKALLVVESPKLEEPVQPVQPQVGTEQVEGGQ